MAAVALLVAAGGCVADDPTNGDGAAPSTRIEASAVALAAHPDGSVYWAELGGTIRRQDRSVVNTVAVSTEGQRGLVGLAIDGAGRVFAGYVGPDLLLRVAEVGDQVGGGVPRLVWLGPRTVQGGNGGRIVFGDDGRLLVGVGLLNDRDAQADPADVTGKIIALDPDGPADQQPEILSGPWNNPFAVTLDASGTLWVADNHPSDGDERLAQGDAGLDPTPVAVLPTDSAPTGLAAVPTADAGDALGTEELWVCSYNARSILRYRRDAGGWTSIGETGEGCRFDVAVLLDGRVAYATDEEIVLITPPT